MTATTLMTWDELNRSALNIDQAEVRWWTVGGYNADVREHRAVYHVRTDWKDFHDGGKGPVGAPFVHQWSVEEPRGDGKGWRCTGRTARGWGELHLGTRPVGDEYQSYETREEAVAQARKVLGNRIKSHRRTLGELREALEALE